ncbi:putative short-chain dehydrogenase [Mollisia scopiformis]|uniref:Putative short-chain dehydrogenase n=1 Tax=Mollisia scopiformis TaxID=149040 RepID=A0A132B706_MOLSC|nr:putative short-chain dehydrogenase [Mollisia scopiformis]KUJ08195.1 putative short-chain dehydrogenase [Mollisia scopiformis]
MTSTTYPEFSESTESLEVAKKFAGEIQERTILVTGVNRGGIGFSTAQAFASQSPSTLIIAGRTPSRIQDCIDALKQEYPEVNYRALKLDLSSQKAVREAAAELLSWTDVPTIDILINNAAVMNLPERQLSEDGLEMQFATNHIGHFLFTNLIMSKLIKGARIVNVTSLSPTVAGMRWSDINFEKTNKDLPEAEQPPYEMHRRWGEVDPEEKSYLPLEGYNQSKVANVLFSIAANKLLYEKHGILSLAVHPGIIQTELGRYAAPETRAAIQEMRDSGMIHFKTLGAGAATSLVAATDPKLGMPGTKDGVENYGIYMMDCQISEKAGSRAVSNSEAERLWKLSEDLVKETFVW